MVTMTQQPGHDDDYDLDAPMTLADYVEIVGDTLDEAVDRLEEHEIRKLCEQIRQKIGVILDDGRRRQLDRRDPEQDRDPNDKWWDR